MLIVTYEAIMHIFCMEIYIYVIETGINAFGPYVYRQ